MDEYVRAEFALLDKRIGACANATKAFAETYPNVQKNFDKLQYNVDEIWKLLQIEDDRIKVLERHDKSYEEMFGHARAMIDAHTSQIQELQKEMMKMRDAYYHVFPERLAQDVQLMRQLDALASKPPLDESPKKT